MESALEEIEGAIERYADTHADQVVCFGIVAFLFEVRDIARKARGDMK